MTSPDLLYLNKLDVNRIQVNEKNYENKTYGYTYNYLNYPGVKDLEIQIPIYLSSTTGIKRWENDNGNVSFTTMLQFPCIDSRQFNEDRTVKLLPIDQIPLKYDPKIKDARPRTTTEMNRELETFNQFALIEDQVRKQGKVSDDLRKHTWNGVIQVKNKRDKEEQIIDDEFHAPSIKFQVGTLKNDRTIPDLICINSETGDEVSYDEIPPFSLINAVFTLGRMHRKTRSVPQPCGLHMYMTRVMYYPPKMMLEGESNIMDMEEMMCDEKRKNKRFLPLEEDTIIVREIENELGMGGGGCKDEMRQQCSIIEKKALNDISIKSI